MRSVKKPILSVFDHERISPGVFYRLCKECYSPNQIKESRRNKLIFRRLEFFRKTTKERAEMKELFLSLFFEIFTELHELAADHKNENDDDADDDEVFEIHSKRELFFLLGRRNVA